MINLLSFFFLCPESQKKKSNNQDDSDEDDDDDDEAGPSTQQMAVVQPQPGYGAPMAQMGMPPVAGTPGMHPGGYQGKKRSVTIKNVSWHIMAKWSESLCIFCIVGYFDMDFIHSFIHPLQ